MAAIGTFIAQGDGYTGSIKTLTLNVKSATFRPNEKSDDKAPDYRIFAGTTEFGAAWKKTSQQNREYLSVKLDDPSFPAPIYASLVEIDPNSATGARGVARAAQRRRESTRAVVASEQPRLPLAAPERAE